MVDIADPQNPQIMGSVATPGFAAAVVASSSHAYVVDGLGLKVIAISDPGNPQIVGSVGTPGSAKGVVLSGSLAYVGDTSFLQVIDVSDPSNPFLAGRVVSPLVRGVASRGATPTSPRGARILAPAVDSP